jgi:hypothetical protein
MFKESTSVFPIRIVITEQAPLRFQESPVDYGKPYDHQLRILLLRIEFPNWREIRSISANIKLKENYMSTNQIIQGF